MKKFKATTQWTESVGVYEITLHTDMGPCYGCAIAHDDDEDHKSEYFGGRIAEMRALVKYFKKRAQHERTEQEALQKFYNAMKDTRTFKPWDFWAKKLEKEIARKGKLVEEWNGKAEAMKKAITESIAARDAMFAAVKDARLKPEK